METVASREFGFIEVFLIIFIIMKILSKSKPMPVDMDIRTSNLNGHKTRVKGRVVIIDRDGREIHHYLNKNELDELSVKGEITLTIEEEPVFVSI